MITSRRRRSTRLPVGSGSTPIILGDSDGVPGDEAAFISSSALDALFRISLGPDDTLITEDSGLIVDDALAVPLSRTRRGVAVLTPRYGLGVLSWPRGKPPSVPIAVAADRERAPRRRRRHRRHLQGCSCIAPIPTSSTSAPCPTSRRPFPADRSPPARRPPCSPTDRCVPYVGPLPGGGPHGAFSAIVAGRLRPGAGPRRPHARPSARWRRAGRSASSVTTAPGWRFSKARSVCHYSTRRVGASTRPSSSSALPWRSPRSSWRRRPEGNGGDYDPSIQGGVELADGAIGVDRGGFVAEVVAPPGSRVYLPGRDDAESHEVLVVGDDGAIEVTIAGARRRDGRRGRDGGDDRRHAGRPCLYQLVDPAPAWTGLPTSVPRRRRRSARPG